MVSSNFSNFWRSRLVVIGGVILSAIALTSCSNVTTDQYEATAKTTYTWQVKYSINPISDKLPRFETFISTSLVNRNGIKPGGAVIGPDDRGLWWTHLPPRPTVDQVEQRKRAGEQATTPQLLKSVDYQMSYRIGDRSVTVPTNYQVYRQVVKAYPQKIPLQLTLGVNDKSVEKAEPLK
jgi:hypothetical protein